MHLWKRIKSHFTSRENMTEKEKNTGRNLFIIEGVTARSIFVLTSGAFLAGYAKHLGANDGFNGILGAIPTLAGITQLISPMVFERIRSRKLLISILCFFHRLLLGSMFFVPFLVEGTSRRLYLLAAIFLLSWVFGQFLTPAASNWIVSLTDQRGRGNYFGRRDSIILAVSTVISLIFGKLLDIFKNAGNPYEGFIIVGIAVFVLLITNFGIITSIKEPRVTRSEQSPKIRDVLTKPLQDKNFRKVIIVCLIWNIGVQIGLAFFPVYMVSGLSLDYAYITGMSTLGSVLCIVAARVFGRLADRTSWPFVTMLSIGMLSVCHSLWFFMCPSNVYFLMPICQIFGGIAWGGINIALFNLQFQYAPEKGRTMYLGFNSALGGFVGFGVAMVGAKLVSSLSGLNISVYGFTIGNMQVVFGLSGILLMVCVISIGKLFKEDTAQIGGTGVEAILKMAVQKFRKEA